MNKKSVAALLWAICLTGSGQNIDSLLNAARIKPDTATINRLYDIGNAVELSDHEKAKKIYLTAGELSEKIGYAVGRIKFASNYTFLLNLEGLFDSSLIINQQALTLASETGDELQINKMLVNTGNVYNYKRFYSTALDYYIQALPYFERAGNRRHLAILHDVMQVLYKNMDQPRQGIVHGRKALSLMTDSPDDIIRGQILINLAMLYSQTVPPEREEQLNSLKEALRIAEINNYVQMKATTLNNLSDYYMQQFDFRLAEQYGRRAMKLNDSIGNVTGHIIGLRGLAYYALYKGNYKESKQHALEALEVAKQLGLPDEERLCYKILADLALLQDRDYVKNQKFVHKSDSIDKTTYNDNVMRATEELKIKYETEKKELQIKSLEARQRFMKLTGITGGAALLFGLLALFWLWLWTKQKRRKAELLVKQLEQEKQLISTQAALDGEMQERSRLARDLHDGLGSILSAAKINMSEFKNGAMLEFPAVERINLVMKLLDDSVQELRRVAHHLMPESLSRYGLKVALTDFCKSIGKVEFAWFGDETRLERQTEIVFYRIAHELVNNALKHSGATHILVHVVQNPDRIALTVEDNGCGFDVDAATAGMGLQNIRTRVGALGGSIEIFSGKEKGEGTEVHVEFKTVSHDTGADS